MSTDQGFAMPYPDFRTAVTETMKHLQHRFGFEVWATTRTLGRDWIMLSVQGGAETPLKEGDVLRWDDTLCARMVQNSGPMIAPTVDEIDAYRDSPVRSQFPIGAYIGAPIYNVDGGLFGTLCAVDPKPQAIEVKVAQEVITHCARLLSALAQLEERRHQDQVYADNLKAYGMIDLDCGLPNPFSWEYLVEREEERCRQLGSPVSVVVLRYPQENVIQKMRHSATLLTGMLRSEDVIARISEYEIGMLMRNSSAPTAEIAGMRVRGVLLAHGVDCSIGWAARHPGKGLLDAIESARWRCQTLAARRA